MTAPRPICPIPPDAKVGDVVVLRSGFSLKITMLADHDGEYQIDNVRYVHKTGRYIPQGIKPFPEFECIAFIYADGRKPNLPKKSDGQAFLESVEESDGRKPNLTITAKPKRTQAQRDAAKIKRSVKSWRVRPISEDERDWLLTIADRLEKQK